MKKAHNTAVGTLLVIDVAIDAYVTAATWLLITFVSYVRRHPTGSVFTSLVVGAVVAFTHSNDIRSLSFWLGFVALLLAATICVIVLTAPRHNRVFDEIEAAER